MGLITKEVEVTLTNNVKYYEDLGYQIIRKKNKWGRIGIPKNTKIKVKVKDLPPRSGIKIDAFCDCCENQLRMQYGQYNKNLHDGKIYCCRCANAIFNTGKNHYKYNFNITDEEREIKRNYPEYVDFIKRVIARDNHTCQCCGKVCNNDAEVHHLDGYDWCIEKRTDDTNGITLCSMCHKSFHNEFGYGNNTKEQYEEWIGYTINNLKKYNGILPTARKIFCVEENKVYDSAIQLSKEFNSPSVTHIYNVCNHKKHFNTFCGKHLLWLDEYENMDKKDLENYLINSINGGGKPIICITTGELYLKVTDAAKSKNIKSISNIISNCKGIYKSCGKLSDGTPLEWMYYEDFLKLPQEEQNEILARNKESSNDGSFIM